MIGETLTIYTGNPSLRWKRQQVIACQPPSDPHMAKHQKAVLIIFCFCHKFPERSSFRANRVFDEAVNVLFQTGMFSERFSAVSGQHPECRPEQVFAVSTGKCPERNRDGFMHRPVFFGAHIVFLFMSRRSHAITAPRMPGICRRAQ
ncbi:hypothetical protein B6J67_13155 [Klebsiella quasipneumoniae]|nr:hypothetical protein B6J67_13155 [Klebsiella quasipneumoniae]PLJ62521.1 hypothetical protein B6J68_12535 [Klebsiella quasipneumoniae]